MSNCISKLIYFSKYKYIFTTEDRPAISILARVIKNQRDKGTSSNKELIGVATSPKLVEEMYKQKILTSKEDIEAFYMPLGEPARIKAFVMDKFDVAPRERSFTVSEFAKFIVRDEGVVAC